MMQETAEKTAAHALDQIREGGTQLVSVVLERLEDVRQAVAEGRFEDADVRARELIGRLTALSEAQRQLGTFGQSYVVRARDLQEGVVLMQWGVVTNVEREAVPVPGDDPHLHVHITCEGIEEPRTVHGDQEMIALRMPEQL
jgi:hypothetical protein